MNAAVKDPYFDVDQHYYEPLDAFTRHLPKGWSERTVQMINIGSRTQFLVAGKLNNTVTNPTFDPIVRPGAMAAYFRGNPERKTLVECMADREPIPSCYRNRDARLAKMDEQGIEYVWLLPTIGMAFEEGMQTDPEAAGVAFRAFNRWLLDDWGFNFRNRIFAAPYLAMGDLDTALAEVDFGLKNGARIFVVRPTAVYTSDGWRSPGNAYFDPVWARIAEAGVTVVPHVAEVGGPPGLDRFLSGGKFGILSGDATPLQIAVGHERPIANYLAALVCDRLFERFPTLHVASVENGADFLPHLLLGLKRAEFQRPGYFKDDPVMVFKRNVWVSPFWEDILSEAVNLIGADRVLFGSDWPHPEGIARPLEWENEVAALNDPVATRKIMFENAAKLTGISV